MCSCAANLISEKIFSNLGQQRTASFSHCLVTYFTTVVYTYKSSINTTIFRYWPAYFILNNRNYITKHNEYIDHEHNFFQAIRNTKNCEMNSGKLTLTETALNAMQIETKQLDLRLSWIASTSTFATPILKNLREYPNTYICNNKKCNNYTSSIRSRPVDDVWNKEKHIFHFHNRGIIVVTN